MPETPPNRATVYELPPPLYHLVAPLFEQVWIDRALIDSVIEGAEPARVFVDHRSHPQTVLMCCDRGDYIVMGDEPAGPFRQFIRDLPAEAEVFDRSHFAFFMPGVDWGDALVQDFDGSIPVFETRSFRYSQPGIEPVARWQERGIGVGGQVRPTDSALVADIDRGALSTGKAFKVRGEEGGEISREWLSRIANDYFGFCTVVGTEIASVVIAFPMSSSYASVGIDTSMPYRRQGHATVACVALIEECLKRNLTPLWNCLATNEGSARTALKLGMEEGPPQRESQWRGGWGDVKPSTGLWSRTNNAEGDHPEIVVWRRS